jgi:hypothetical protein
MRIGCLREGWGAQVQQIVYVIYIPLFENYLIFSTGFLKTLVLLGIDIHPIKMKE